MKRIGDARGDERGGKGARRRESNNIEITRE